MKVVIIGSGNVATVRGKKIAAAGHQLVQVMSRNESHARQLASTLDCDYTSQWDTISGDGELYLLAVPDRLLTDIKDLWNQGKKLTVHTAGSVSKEVLASVSKNYGVLYPLQSLNKNNPVMPEIPLLVDGNTSDDLALIQDFASTISNRVQVAGDQERMKMHVAAVIINNFSNHLYTLASDYCKKEGLDFKSLLPLAKETVERLNVSEPRDVQTGPATRDDRVTIQKHLELLSDDAELQELYRFFSLTIARYYSKAIK